MPAKRSGSVLDSVGSGRRLRARDDIVSSIMNAIEWVKESLAEREKPLVGGQREKLFELVGDRQLFEQQARVAESTGARPLLAGDPDEHRAFLPDERFDARPGDDFARLEPRAM